MTQEAKHANGGRAPRRPVVYAGKRVPGLLERKTGDGRVVFELRKKINGRVVRRTLAAATPTDAIREARALVAKLDTGARLVGRADTSLRELRDAWEVWARSPGSNYSPRTVDLYCDALDRHVLPHLRGETKVAGVTTADLRFLIDKMNGRRLAGSSVHRNLTALSALLRFAVRRGLIDANPVRLLERGDRPSAKRRREPRYLDRSEIDRLLVELGDEFRPVAACLAFAGLRVSEALALRWEDVDFGAAMLHVPGTKTVASAQPVPMIADLVSELRAHRARQTSLAQLRPDALVFGTATGRRQWRKNVLRALYRAGDRAGLNPEGAKRVSCHDLRHSCAGLLLAARVPAPRVAAILRHADTRTTLTVYAGLVESQRGKLVADLEAAFQ